VDDEKFAQRFTPRRNKSPVSEMNKERIRRLIRKKRMTAAGLKAVSIFFDKDKTERFVIAQDILKALKADRQTWKNFQNFSEGYRRVRVGYIEHSREQGKKIFQKRLDNFIRMTEKNKRFGMLR
jgi:uncharacterized protein YdeI (YjbR/CyaY-like superfamily)